jgi:hypothetical protein
MWRRQDSNLGRLSRQIYSGPILSLLTWGSQRPDAPWRTPGGITTSGRLVVMSPSAAPLP